MSDWTVAHQAPLSMGFSRPEYRSELPFPSPGDDPGIEPTSLISPVVAGGFFTTSATWEAQGFLKRLQTLSLSQNCLRTKKHYYFRNSLAVWWLGLCLFTARGSGSIPGQGTKIPQAVSYWQKTPKKQLTTVFTAVWPQQVVNTSLNLSLPSVRVERKRSI